MPHQGAPLGRAIVLNGRACELHAPGTPAAALEELGLEPGARGVAVAVDGEVVPRAEWDSLELSEGSRVEVLSAMQGG
ncbi:MAG TPA: sulfur carrier protein ThiS [Solirubrobacteraceae bacterium]